MGTSSLQRHAAARWWLCLSALLCVPVLCRAAAPPSLTAVGKQQRTPAENIGPLRLWDTLWWIDLEARAASLPLTRIDYRVRFIDGPDARSQSGGWDIADETNVRGRVLITLPTRPDYDRRMRVELRAHDGAGSSSDWILVELPPTEDSRFSAPNIPVLAAPHIDQKERMVGTVEVETNDRMTLGDVRQALQEKARDQGASAVLGLRLVRSDAQHVVFAADLVRYVDATPTAAPPKTGEPAAERLLGEIVIPAARR